MTRTLISTAVMAAALALVGCGPSNGSGAAAGSPSAAAKPASSPAAVDLCAKVTGAEVEAITGVKVGVVTSAKATDSETGRCEYQHADTKSFGTSIIAATAAYKAEKVDAQEKVWTTLLKSDPVPGVGDVARYNEAGSALFVRKGAKAVTVQMLDFKGDGKARLEALGKLATLVLDRM